MDSDGFEMPRAIPQALMRRRSLPPLKTTSQTSSQAASTTTAAATPGKSDPFTCAASPIVNGTPAAAASAAASSNNNNITPSYGNSSVAGIHSCMNSASSPMMSEFATPSSVGSDIGNYMDTSQSEGSRYAGDQSTASSTTGLTPVTDVHYVVNSNNKRLLDASNVGSNSMLALRRNGSSASASSIGSMSDDSDDDVVLPSATKRSRSNSITSTPQLNNNSNSSNSNSSSASGGVLPYEPLPPTPRDNGPRSTPNPYWPMTYSPPESMSSSDVHETFSEALGELRTEPVSNNNNSSSNMNNMISSSSNSNNMNNISSNNSNSSSSSDSSAQAAPAKRRRDDIDDTDVVDGSLDDSTLDADKNSKRAKRS
eukprot:3994-Heterococcus_DN1.PRE.1